MAERIKELNQRGKLMKSPKNAFEAYTMTSPDNTKNTEDIAQVKLMQ